MLVEPAVTTPNVRLGKPMPTVWDISKRQPGLLEGKLEFRVHLAEEQFYTYTTDDVVLHEPDQRLRFLFPAVTDPINTPELEVDVTWIGKSGGRVPLKMQLLRIPFTAQKTLMMVVGDGRGSHGRSQVWEERLESLKPEALASDTVRAQLQNRDNFLPLQTVPHTWDANQFPQEPLAYTPYDAVVLTGEIFGGLRQQQLAAIETWVRAGGRLYVEPDSLLEASHIDFLNRLTVHDQPPVRWSLDRVGKLDWPVLNDADEYWAAVDLGRVVLRHPLSDSPKLSQRSLWFLWDIPPGVDPVQQLMRGPRISTSGPQVLPNGAVVTTNIFSPNSSPPRRLADEVETLLMPSGVQIVPVWLIAVLLGGLVLAIGPGEWWLLGKLRLRRFTWLTWPAATIAVTAITVALSNWYMSSAETLRILKLVDLGQDGRVVRSQQFELVFPSRAKPVTADVQRGLWRVVQAPADMLNSMNVVFLGRTTARSGQPVNAARPIQNRDALKRLAPPVYDGRVPNRFTAAQTVPQWTPRLSHRYELPGEDRDGPLDWTTIDSEWATIDPRTQGQLVAPTANVQAEVTRQLPQTDGVMVINRAAAMAAQGPVFRQSALLATWLQALTMNTPTGGTDLWTTSSDRFGWSDLPILSSTGPHDFAVLVVVPEDTGWTVYRRPVCQSQIVAKTEP